MVNGVFKYLPDTANPVYFHMEALSCGYQTFHVEKLQTAYQSGPHPDVTWSERDRSTFSCFFTIPYPWSPDISAKNSHVICPSCIFVNSPTMAEFSSGNEVCFPRVYSDLWGPTKIRQRTFFGFICLK